MRHLDVEGLVSAATLFHLAQFPADQTSNADDSSRLLVVKNVAETMKYLPICDDQINREEDAALDDDICDGVNEEIQRMLNDAQTHLIVNADIQDRDIESDASEDLWTESDVEEDESDEDADRALPFYLMIDADAMQIDDSVGSTEAAAGAALVEEFGFAGSAGAADVQSFDPYAGAAAAAAGADPLQLVDVALQTNRQTHLNYRGRVQT